MALRSKSDLHLARKIWHLVGIIGMILIYNYFGTRQTWFILAGLGAFFFPLDLLRQSRPGLNQATQRVFGAVMRKHESNSLSGLSYLLLGAMILLAFFPRHIINLSLLFLAFGDPLASYVGIRFGRDRILGNKTLQGTLAAFFACAGIAGVYYYLNGIMTERLLIVAPISGLIGAATELIPIWKLDDNLTCPVLSAVGLSALFYLYGGFM
ncbi:dolichol kinase [soil metagenome]